MIVQPESLAPRSRRRRIVRIVGVTAPAVLLAGVVAAGILGPPAAEPERSSPDVPVVAIADPRAQASPSEPARAAAVAPNTLAGLEVHGVRWTVEARSRGLARGVIAVAGYLGMDSIPETCGDDQLSIIGTFCDRVAVLAEAPWHGLTLAQPDAPGFHLHPQFRAGIAIPSQAASVAISASAATPAVIVLGRFSDARAQPCIPEGRHCGQEFVVERVAWVEGDEYPITPTVDPAADVTGRTVADLRREGRLAASALAPGGYPLLSVFMSPGSISRMEPSAAPAAAELEPSTAVWFVRALRARGDPVWVDWWIVDVAGDRILAQGEVATTRIPGADAGPGEGDGPAASDAAVGGVGG